MSEQLLAKTILKNKFWIVEDSTNNKVATIQAVEDGSFVFVDKQSTRQKYPSIKLLTAQHNIAFDKSKKTQQSNVELHDLYGFPISQTAHNIYCDIQHKFAVFTKNKKSKSFFCAGYYAIKFNHGWVKAYCPKLITLNRYEFIGPFKTKLEALEQARFKNNLEGFNNGE
jgi:hypothetical protein